MQTEANRMRAAQIAPEPKALNKAHIAGIMAGNALEFYDFITYVYYASHIADAFFPAAAPLNKLMRSFAVFGVGFIPRPIGAWLIGAYADKVGRRPAMVLSFSLMGLGLLGLGLCPTYAMIGIWSPILAICCRLVQGFALGGEVGPSTTFLLEAAPPHLRGLYTAFQSISQNLASMAAGLVGLTLGSLLTAPQMGEFGWRIAMLLGTLVVPFGLLMRRTLPETLTKPETQSVNDSAHLPATQEGLTRRQIRVILCGIAMLCGGTVATYVQSYLPTYTSVVLHMNVDIAFGATVIYSVVGIICNVGGALLSERYGRRVVMIIPRALLLLVILPCFWLLVEHHDAQSLIMLTIVTTLFASISDGPMMGALTESLTKTKRATIFSILYAGPIVVFGGTTQLLVTWLISITGDILAPAYFYMTATLAALIGMIAIPESAPSKIANEEHS